MGKVLLDAFATCAVVLVLAGCGGDDESPASSSPAAVTPVPSQSAVPTATADIHASPSAEATSTATATATAPSGAGTGGAEAGGDEGGDESGIRIPVDVTVTADRIRASTEEVAAFLPLRFTVRNTLDRELQVVVVRSGEGGAAVGRVTVGAHDMAGVDVEGLQPGSLEVLSPDLDPDMTAIVRVVRGG